MNYHRFFFSSIVSIILGVLIYLLFRTSSLNVFSWLKKIGVSPFVERMRDVASPFYSIMPKWALYSLPDGLWIFSYVCLILYIWKGIISVQSVFWIAIVPLVAVVSEIFQSIGWVEGTFDFFDLVFYLIGGILPFLIFKNSINYNNSNFLKHEKN